MAEYGRTEKKNIREADCRGDELGAKRIRPRLKVQLTGTEPFFGPGVRTLLESIRKEGSVREACEKMGLSYSKGRKMLERAERELGYTMLVFLPFSFLKVRYNFFMFDSSNISYILSHFYLAIILRCVVSMMLTTSLFAGANFTKAWANCWAFVSS